MSRGVSEPCHGTEWLEHRTTECHPSVLNLWQCHHNTWKTTAGFSRWCNVKWTSLSLAKKCFLKAYSIGHCNNTVRMNTSLILNGYISKVETPDELLACILDAAACIKKSEDQLRWKTRDFRTQVAKCTEVDGGIFEQLLWAV